MTSATSAIAKTEWDVVIVGAGPAGGMAAFEAARRGASVLLVDKAHFPRYKVCGCCLNLRALDALESAGLGGMLEANGAVPLDGFRLAAGGCHVDLILPGGAALSRRRLDRTLVESAVEQGAVFIPKCRAVLGPTGGTARTVTLRIGETAIPVMAKVVVAADGLTQSSSKGEFSAGARVSRRSHIGAGAVLSGCAEAFRQGTIYMASGREGYVGLVRIEDGMVNVAAALNPEGTSQARSLATVAARIVDEAGFSCADDLSGADWTGTPPLTRSASRLSADRLLFVGDASGYVEPFTGEGMAWALSAGRAAGRLATESLDTFDASTEETWHAQHGSLIGGRQRLCRFVAMGLRHPTLVKAGVRALSIAPQLATPFIKRLNRTEATGAAVES